jgi:hypothetical protein
MKGFLLSQNALEGELAFSIKPAMVASSLLYPCFMLQASAVLSMDKARIKQGLDNKKGPPL